MVGVNPYAEIQRVVWEWRNTGIPPEDMMEEVEARRKNLVDALRQNSGNEEDVRSTMEKVDSVRDMISRLQVCHFLFRDHLFSVIKSIGKMEPATDPGTIGCMDRHISELLRPSPHSPPPYQISSDPAPLPAHPLMILRIKEAEKYSEALLKWLENEDLTYRDDDSVIEEIRRLGPHTEHKDKLVRSVIWRLRGNSLYHTGLLSDIRGDNSGQKI